MSISQLIRPIHFAHDYASGVKIETDPSERGFVAPRQRRGRRPTDTHDSPVADGFGSVRAPFRLEPTQARTTLVGARGLDWLVQVIADDEGAPER